MRTSLLALAMLVSAMPASLQASKAAHRPSMSASHKVHRGETAARIARDNGLTLTELADLNPRLNLAKLNVGTLVKIHGAPARAHQRRDLQPMPPLPATPAPGPTSLTHLERILPSHVRDLSAVPPGDAHPALAEFKAVLPPAEADAAPAPEGFEPADPAHLDLLWPVETRTVSSAWGPRMRSKTVRVKAARRRVRYRGSHKGVDLTAPKGTDVLAALDGRVVASGKQKGYGNYVTLDHGNGVVTLYGHHNRNFVREGEIVRRGQKIAEVGRTGNATGPHLHFELRVDGAVQNPLPYLNDVEELPAEQVAQNQAMVAPKTRR
jgi:murein DD-endopeptidase MepM/ murein hydrolase activator NlpD